MREELLHFKERYQAEKHTGESRKRELDAMEAKGATLKRTLEHDQCRLVQMQIAIEKEREKLQAHVRSRFSLLVQNEDAQYETDGLMQQKADLVRKKNELREQVRMLEDKQREVAAQ